MRPVLGLVSLAGLAIHKYWVLGAAIGSWSLDLALCVFPVSSSLWGVAI